MAINITAGANNPFAGGSRTPNAPPPNLGGSIAPASTGNNPIGGVNPPGQPFFARQNEGSNIGIPYTRLVPVGSIRSGPAYKLGASPGDGERYIGGLGSDEAKDEPDGLRGERGLITPTQDMRATRIGFILAKRSDKHAGDANGTFYFGPDESRVVGFMAPGMPGTERFQQMCSLEFLKRHFSVSLKGAMIDLSAQKVPEKGVAATDAKYRGWDNGLLGMLKANKTFRDGAARDEGTALATGDLAKFAVTPNAVAAVGPDIKQGIFAGDVGPFLRGKGGASCPQMINGTVNGAPEVVDKKTVNPFHVSRCIGDDVAFALLEKELEAQGMTDFRPDGIVLSKGANDPSDKMSDEFFESRDGQLFNMRIQGPAHTTTWTGDPSMEVLPGDKVFIVIIADVWFDVTNLADELAKVRVWMEDSGNVAKWNAYAGARDQYFKDENGDARLVREQSLPEFEGSRAAAFRSATEKTVLANFRVATTTSSQMINYSTLKFDSNGEQVVDRRTSDGPVSLVHGASRMGLRLGDKCSEYIVGGWQIGTVLDSSASRAVFSGAGTNIGVRTAPNSMAHSIYVDISWWSADRMWRTFMNVEGTVKPRFLANEPGGPQKRVNLPYTDAQSLARQAPSTDVGSKAGAIATKIGEVSAAVKALSKAEEDLRKADAGTKAAMAQAKTEKETALNDRRAELLTLREELSGAITKRSAKELNIAKLEGVAKDKDDALKKAQGELKPFQDDAAAKQGVAAKDAGDAAKDSGNAAKQQKAAASEKDKDDAVALLRAKELEIATLEAEKAAADKAVADAKKK